MPAGCQSIEENKLRAQRWHAPLLILRCNFQYSRNALYSAPAATIFDRETVTFVKITAVSTLQRDLLTDAHISLKATENVSRRCKRHGWELFFTFIYLQTVVINVPVARSYHSIVDPKGMAGNGASDSEVELLRDTVASLSSEIARLKRELGDLHGTDTVALRRAYKSLAQHVAALQEESRKVEDNIHNLQEELLKSSDIAQAVHDPSSHPSLL
ncbi:hypothetical protein ABBQ38_002569 [Trebouxia sp. C0009 RCD-2024]